MLPFYFWRQWNLWPSITTVWRCKTWWNWETGQETLHFTVDVKNVEDPWIFFCFSFLHSALWLLFLPQLYEWYDIWQSYVCVCKSVQIQCVPRLIGSGRSEGLMSRCLCKKTAGPWQRCTFCLLVHILLSCFRSVRMMQFFFYSPFRRPNSRASEVQPLSEPKSASEGTHVQHHLQKHEFEWG